MPQFIITYFRCNRPSTPSESEYLYESYESWVDSMDNVENLTDNIHTIASNGSVTKGIQTAMPGYIVFRTESMDKALEIAKSCPFLVSGGHVEVAELVYSG